MKTNCKNMPGMEFWQIISKCESLWCSSHSWDASASFLVGVLYRQVAFHEPEAVTLLGLRALTRSLPWHSQKLEFRSQFMESLMEISGMF